MVLLSKVVLTATAVRICLIMQNIFVHVVAVLDMYVLLSYWSVQFATPPPPPLKMFHSTSSNLIIYARMLELCDFN